MAKNVPDVTWTSFRDSFASKISFFASWSNSFTQRRDPEIVAVVARTSRKSGCDADISPSLTIVDDGSTADVEIDRLLSSSRYLFFLLRCRCDDDFVNDVNDDDDDDDDDDDIQ